MRFTSNLFFQIVIVASTFGNLACNSRHSQTSNSYKSDSKYAYDFDYKSAKKINFQYFAQSGSIRFEAIKDFDASRRGRRPIWIIESISTPVPIVDRMADGNKVEKLLDLLGSLKTIEVIKGGDGAPPGTKNPRASFEVALEVGKIKFELGETDLKRGTQYLKLTLPDHTVRGLIVSGGLIQFMEDHSKTDDFRHKRLSPIPIDEIKMIRIDKKNKTKTVLVRAGSKWKLQKGKLPPNTTASQLANEILLIEIKNFNDNLSFKPDSLKSTASEYTIELARLLGKDPISLQLKIENNGNSLASTPSRKNQDFEVEGSALTKLRAL